MPKLHVTPREFRAIVRATQQRRFIPIMLPGSAPYFYGELDEFIEGLLLWFGATDLELAACRGNELSGPKTVDIVRHHNTKVPEKRLEFP